jgi:ABC-type bacteriocin/lantibiotic exporter with double-glycine peptidase domain
VANILPVPHHQQVAEGYCLPACAQMALAHLGIFRSQEELARVLKMRVGAGVTASNITLLASKTLAIGYSSGTLTDLAGWLAKSIPIIAFIQAGELPYWRGHRFQHAVVVIGLDEEQVFLLDPAKSDLTTVVSEEFLLAWDEMDNTYAIMTKK